MVSVNNKMSIFDETEEDFWLPSDTIDVLEDYIDDYKEPEHSFFNPNILKKDVEQDQEFF